MSLRTFHESFLSGYGMTPKAYLRTLRIDAARRELMRAEPGVTVTEAALVLLSPPPVLRRVPARVRRGPVRDTPALCPDLVPAESTAPSARELGHAKK